MLNIDFSGASNSSLKWSCVGVTPLIFKALSSKYRLFRVTPSGNTEPKSIQINSSNSYLKSNFYYRYLSSYLF